jgi:uncharacterized protein (TIGR00251 family)
MLCQSVPAWSTGGIGSAMPHVRLKIKVVPKASRNAIAGWLGDELKVMVTAAPEKGKANKAVIEILAQALQLPKQAIRITGGQTSPHKTLELDDIDEPELQRRLLLQ